jgi:hypothetical protein
VSEFVSSRRALYALFAVACVGVLSVHPTWAKSLGADVWNMPALKEQLRETQSDIARLDAEDQGVRQRIAVKESLIQDLLAGRATLAEVTEQFTALDATRPEYMDVLRANYPAASDREVMARNVISYAMPRVPAEERDAVSSKLEADLRHMLSGAAAAE